MNVSLNEIEQTALKAARGAGFAWGLAEEVAVATRWLAAIRLDAAGLLADLLADLLGDEIRMAQSDAFCCPVRRGLALVESGLIDTTQPTIVAVRRPVWLLPFLVRLADDAMAVAVSWPGHEAILAAGPSGIGLAGAGASLDAEAGHARVSLVIPPRPAARVVFPRAGGCDVDPAVWARLNRLEARTYVPASRHSRVTGAGAVSRDND